MQPLFTACQANKRENRAAMDRAGWEREDISKLDGRRVAHKPGRA